MGSEGGQDTLIIALYEASQNRVQACLPLTRLGPLPGATPPYTYPELLNLGWGGNPSQWEQPPGPEQEETILPPCLQVGWDGFGTRLLPPPFSPYGPSPLPAILTAPFYPSFPPREPAPGSGPYSGSQPVPSHYLGRVLEEALPTRQVHYGASPLLGVTGCCYNSSHLPAGGRAFWRNYPSLGGREDATGRRAVALNQGHQEQAGAPCPSS